MFTVYFTEIQSQSLGYAAIVLGIIFQRAHITAKQLEGHGSITYSEMVSCIHVSHDLITSHMTFWLLVT